jgi:hypothetical protein
MGRPLLPTRILAHEGDSATTDVTADYAADVRRPRYTRRLSDKILIAFHHACDQADLEVAQDLLNVLEYLLRRPPSNPEGRERRVRESLVAAYERFWHIRHPKDPD